MALIFPTIENINRLKVKPTDGERYLIEYLIEHLPSDVEIYFKPFMNGDMPDIILMKKGVGATVIEVNDWDLLDYNINSNNEWYSSLDGLVVKSPFHKIKNYKDNLFNLHISGLLEKKINNNMFYGRIKTYVYFHKAMNKDIQKFSTQLEIPYKEYARQCHVDFHKKILSHENYIKKLDENKEKQKKLMDGFTYDAVGCDQLQRISLPREDNLNLFSEDIYDEFRRYLQPPYHVLEQGKEIKYTDQQESIIKSNEKKQKVKGIAGSGKTVLLAKMAVDEYKNTQERVLILTYNITLKGYIQDHINDVRENFSWAGFCINNYHDFFEITANSLYINTSVSSETIEQYGLGKPPRKLTCYKEKNFYSNIKLFEKHNDEIIKYNTILIDEIQDYKPEWIEIIKKYFLKENGKIILFGDEKQNVYHQELDIKKRTRVTKGFGHWKSLTKPKRQLAGGDRILDLSKKFQQAFFGTKYELDDYKKHINQLRLSDGVFTTFNHNDILRVIGKYRGDPYPELDSRSYPAIENITKKIFKEMKLKNIHPNDVVILSSKIGILREVDFYFRKFFKSKTITTFETKEMFDILTNDNKHGDIKNIRHNKKLAFNPNSGMLKISTIHSFKGFEAPTVFLILGNEEYLLRHDVRDESDPECIHWEYKEKYDEIVYTGITRSKSNLMVFLNENDKFYDFFSVAIGKYEDKEREKNIFETINSAISSQTSIDIIYKQHTETIEQKNIKPYKVLFMNGNHYVACEVDNKYKFSMFRLSSIKNVITSNKKFDLDLDIQDFIANIQTPFSSYRENYRDYLIQVIVEVDKSKAHFFNNKLFLPSQKEIETKNNGNLLLSFEVTRDIEVEELIKKWLPFVKVIEPLRLDEKIRSDLRIYLNS